MDDKEKLRKALDTLDPKNDAHWIESGLPNLDYLKTETNDQSIKRADVTALCPEGFNRSNAHAAPSFVTDKEAPEQDDDNQPDETDAIDLFERAVAASLTDRYRRNSALMTLVRGYQVSQAQIKEVQGRLDARRDRRRETNIAE